MKKISMKISTYGNEQMNNKYQQVGGTQTDPG